MHKSDNNNNKKYVWLSAVTHIVVVFNQVDNVRGVIGQFTGCRGLNDVRKFLIDGKLVLGDCKDDADWLLFQLCRDLRDAGVVLVGALCVDVVVHVTVAVVGQNNATKLQQVAELQTTFSRCISFFFRRVTSFIILKIWSLFGVMQLKIKINNKNLLQTNKHWVFECPTSSSCPNCIVFVVAYASRIFTMLLVHITPLSLLCFWGEGGGWGEGREKHNTEVYLSISCVMKSSISREDQHATGHITPSNLTLENPHSALLTLLYRLSYMVNLITPHPKPDYNLTANYAGLILTHLNFPWSMISNTQ